MKYGLIGERLSHSYSKIIHALLGNKEYELVEISPDRLKQFLTARDFIGVNVTIPYKRDVLPYCELSKEARRIGSVNTIIHRDDKLFGDNTDYAGFSYMARCANLSFAGKKVLITGSGGTAGTVRCVATDAGAAEIVMVSRNGDTTYEHIFRHCDADILINTTPVGMYPNNGQCPLDIENFYRLEGVLDVIYNPLKTQLLLCAEKRDIRCAGGLSMLVAQAVYAHRLFFGLEANQREEDRMIEDVLTGTRRLLQNIVLVGMPGCGKTTTGRLLAARLGFDFVDTDEVIHEKTGNLPAQMIEEHGESYFREIESDVIRDVTKRTGQVISTGGGSVTVPTNRDAMRQNGYIVYLEREINMLVTAGRPLSSCPETLRLLYEQRAPLYQALCDLRIEVTGGPDDVAQRIVSMYS